MTNGVVLLSKETLDDLEQWGTDVIFGRARGFRAGVMRAFLRGLSWIYRGLIELRLSIYRHRIKHERNLGTLVISIGNITVGGTGKTPVVELFARTLRDKGRRVAILSRGYKSKELETPQDWHGVPAEEMPKLVSDGEELLLGPEHAGDEPYMLAKNLKGVAVVVDRDRVKGGRFAVNQLGVDTLLLDDGMQYLDLGHELDVVLVDSQAPFGTGAMLPRGTMREPAKSLRRASYLFLTKCQGASNEELIKKIRKHNRTADLIECTHGPIQLENVFTGEVKPLSFLDGKYVACISGIARPESFEGAVEALGAKVEIRRAFNDHHWFEQKDIDEFMTRCVDRDMELIVTTEKDAVRFPKPSELDVPIYFLRIEVDILRGQENWDRCIERILAHEKARQPHQW